MTTHIAYLSLGSNKVAPVENIKQTTKYINNTDVKVVHSSTIYKTEPQGRKDVPWYCNAVLAIQTVYTPQELLQYTIHIESLLGRKRTGILHEPRTIDIDILLYDTIVMRTETLSIPHLRMCERAFVLIPLQEIAPHILIHGKTPQQHLHALSYSIEGNIIWQ